MVWVDKPYSYTLEDIRAATWDIAMAGVYVVAGFGSTCLGGTRNITTFLPVNPNNPPWIERLLQVKKFFPEFAYGKLAPHEELVTSRTLRAKDRAHQNAAGAVKGTSTLAFVTTYWCLAELGKAYVVYVRGMTEPVTLALPADTRQGGWRAEQFNPRSSAGEQFTMGGAAAHHFDYRPPDAQDWLIVVRRGN